MDNFFKRMWLRCVPLKVAVFVWELAEDKIPILDNLASKGVVLRSDILCKGCHKEEETADHLFFGCEFYSNVWKECLRWSDLSA